MSDNLGGLSKDGFLKILSDGAAVLRSHRHWKRALVRRERDPLSYATFAGYCGA